MSEKITPEQAWQHVKALWPDAIGLSRDEFGASLLFRNRSNGLSVSIDWPEGMDRYPPAEPTYREPTQADVGKMVEVRDHHSQRWQTHELLAILPTVYQYRYIVDTTRDTAEATFDYFTEARIAVDDQSVDANKMDLPHPDARPIRTAPKDQESWLLMGGEWRKGVWSVNNWVSTDAVRGYTWDLQNQPTHWRPIK